MLRISQTTSSDGGLILRLEGRIAGPWVAEVRRSCELFFVEGHQVKLDLADVSFADRDGLSLIRDLTQRQISLVNCPLFLTEQLKEPEC